MPNSEGVPGPLGRFLPSGILNLDWTRRGRQAPLSASLAGAERICGNGEPANSSLIQQLQQEIQGLFSKTQSAGAGRTASLGLAGAATSLSLSSLSTLGSGSSPISRISAPYLTPRVRSIFARSIDFSKVFVSYKTGFQNRPFTVAMTISPAASVSITIQVMNLGTHPDEATIVHEMTHVWQSQHHSDPLQFMRNCISCQAVALRRNSMEVVRSPAIAHHRAFPWNYPFSAYAYLSTPKSSFSSYGGEQIAEQVEGGETDIIAHVRDIAANVVDSDNVTSLNVNTSTVADRRAPKVTL